MLDDFLVGQPIVFQTLKNTVIKNRLTHAYIFKTNGYAKAFDVALAFAKFLCCPNNYTNNKLCNNCFQCQAIDDGNFPEIKVIETEGMWIKKEQLDSLQEEFSKKAIVGNKKIYIIKDADRMNIATANSILKFLEEPEENIIAILLVDNIYQLLDTIVSRCQIVSFKKNNINDLLEQFSNNDTELVKIASFLCNNEKDLEKFVNDEKNAEKVKAAVNFVNYYEKNHLKTILHMEHLFNEIFIERKDVLFAFEIILLYYKDVLNIKLKKEPAIFNTDELNEIALNNSFKQLYHKINTIIDLKNKISNNINLKLLLDKFVIAMEEGE